MTPQIPSFQRMPRVPGPPAGDRITPLAGGVHLAQVVFTGQKSGPAAGAQLAVTWIYANHFLLSDLNVSTRAAEAALVALGNISREVALRKRSVSLGPFFLPLFSPLQVLWEGNARPRQVASLSSRSAPLPGPWLELLSSSIHHDIQYLLFEASFPWLRHLQWVSPGFSYMGD